MNWLSDNWKFLFDGVAGAAAVTIIGYICKRWLWPQPPEQSADLKAQGASVHDSPVASGSDIVQTITHNYYPPAAVVSPPASEPDPAPEAQQRDAELASLRSLPAREVLVHLNSGVWHEASTDLDTARRAIVLPFKNVPKPPGQRTPRASDVSASLVFKNTDNSDEAHINHGVWLGNYEYPTTFNPGVTRDLLVALKDVPFVTLENPNLYNPFTQRRARSGTTIHSPQMKTIWKQGTVEIVLVDGDSVTMFHGMFEYELSIENMVLIPKNLSSGTKVHFVPDPYNHGWAGNDGRTDIRAGGIFTYEGDETLTIVDAFLKGTTPKGKMTVQILVAGGLGPMVSDTVELHGHTPVRVALNLWAEPIDAERGKPMRGQLVLRDVYNKEYEINPVDFQWIGQPLRKLSDT